MKPVFQFGSLKRALSADNAAPERRFPRIEYCFQSRFGQWRGYSSPYDDESGKFHNLTREFLLESAREQKKEMIVFALVVLTAAWAVIYMVVMVVRLLLRSAP
jgi:hypothetical protein